MDDQTLYTNRPDVVSTMTGDELVLLSFTTETYYGLNPVGARVWDLLGQGASVDTLCTVLGAEYDVTGDVLRTDVRQVLSDLAAHALIVPQEG